MNNNAPIVLFVYNRPVHTQKTLEALFRNKGINQSKLFIFSDAPKNEDNLNAVDKTREVIRNFKGAETVEIIERTTNKGLAESIIEGVTDIICQYGKIIVLEDDLVTSPYFITYMNEALSLYQNDDEVMHISGYIPPIKKKLPPTFFYNQASCWGWATWEKAWSKFENKPSELVDKIINTNRVNEFNIDGSVDFLNQLEQNARGEIKTWAIKWQAAVFLNNGLCLHPNKSLVQNIGLDWSGIHTGPMPQYYHKSLAEYIRVEKTELLESQSARKAMVSFYKANKQGKSLLYKLKKYIFK